MAMDRVNKRRRHTGSAKFGAPWGRSVKLNTGLVMTILLVVLLVPLFVVPRKTDAMLALWLTPVAVVLVFGVTTLFAVCGFTVGNKELEVQRLVWKTRLPLNGLKAVYADPEAMKGSLRKMGNGGYLAYSGWFWNRRLGGFRAFVTDSKRCVVLRFADRTLVVSPDDPEAFIEALGFDARANGGAA